MAEVGRPTIFTQEVLHKLEYAFSMGCTDNEACIYADISPSSLYNYQKENPKFLERKDQLKENPVLKARTKVFKELDKNVLTAQWFLERKKKDEFSARIEQTGKDGESLQPQVIVYGNTDPLQLATRTAPTTDTPKPSEIQGDSVAPQGTQDNTGNQRTDTMGERSEGDVLVHSPILQPSEEDSLAGSGDVSEILPTGDMEEPK